MHENASFPIKRYRYHEQHYVALTMSSTMSSEIYLESELHHKSLICSKMKTFFTPRCLTVRFMAYLRDTENENGPQKHEQVRFVPTVIHWRDISCFCFDVFFSSDDVEQFFCKLITLGWHRPLWRCYPTHDDNMMTMTVTGVELQSRSIRVIMGVVRSVLTRETRWYSNN